MYILNLKVFDKMLSFCEPKKSRIRIIGDNRDYALHFETDVDKQALFALFKRDGKESPPVLLDENGNAPIPLSVLKDGHFEVGLYADGYATTPLYVPVEGSILNDEGVPIEEIDETQVEQLIALANSIASVTKAEVNEDGDLIVTLSAGGEESTVNAGTARGNGIAKLEQTVTSDEDGGTNEVTVTFTNGETTVLRFLNGKRGNGIEKAEQTLTSDESGGVNRFTFTTTDGEEAVFEVRNGAKGDKGDAGLTPNISIGTVSTVSPTESASATVTGTSENPVLNLSIPKGSDGASPKIEISDIENGRKVVVTNADGTKQSYDILNTNVDDLKEEILYVEKGNNLLTGFQTVKDADGNDRTATNFVDISQYDNGTKLTFWNNNTNMYLAYGLFNESGEYIVGANTSTSGYATITKSESTKYFAYMNTRALNTCKTIKWFILGNSRDDYIPDIYYFKNEKIKEISGDKLIDGSVGISKFGDDLVVEYPTNNLFKAEKMLGSYTVITDAETGKTQTIVNASNWISIEKGKKYVSNLGWTQYYFFDADKNYHSMASYSYNAPITFTAPCDGYLIVARCNTNVILIEGTSLSNYYETYYMFNPKFIPEKENGKWKNKKWLAIGDSITDASVADKGYPYYVSSNLGLICTNVGNSGKAVSYFHDKIASYSDDFDLITVLLGTNNQGYGCPIGEINDSFYTSGDYSSNNSFIAQLQHLIDLLLEKYPTKTIAFFTPIKRANPSSTLNDDGYQVNPLGLTTEPYAKAVMKVCDYYGLPCLDLYTCGINPRTENMRKLYFLREDGTDGTHPNNAGHAKFIAPAIIDFINRISPCEE